LSQSDPPLWIRVVAAGLLLFASWWLLKTDVLRDVIGESVGAVGLVIVAIPVLRGLHMPLRIWPEGPWRRSFKASFVVACAGALAAVLLLTRPVMTDALADRADVGTFVLVAAGTVFLGFGLAMVRQASYLPWYGLAGLLALAPALVSVLLGALTPTADGSVSGCFLAAAPGCAAAGLPAFCFLLALGVPSKLVTEELAFRRLLIGCGRRTGLVWVLGAALAAAAWYGILAASGVGSVALVILGGLGGVAAGCLYVLSCSLVVSTVFSAVLAAGYAALMLARQAPADTSAPVQMLPTSWIVVLALVALMLAVSVAKKNGLIGSLVSEDEADAAGD
jgi:hypothetical protein